MDGTIKRIPEGKTFGFIAREGKEDLFFHESQLIGLTLSELQPGTAVTFEIETDAKGDHAIQVKKA